MYSGRNGITSVKPVKPMKLAAVSATRFRRAALVVERRITRHGRMPTASSIGHARTGSPRRRASCTWMLSMKRTCRGSVCITSDSVRVPSPKKRTPFISDPSVTPVAAKMSDAPGARSAAR